jgi:hypothetical protein
MIYRNYFADDYYGGSGWTAVQKAFETTEPEPANVLYADYDIDGYEGDANILWKNPDGTFSFVNGWHCSCYGLEGQFAPEVYTKEVLDGLIERAKAEEPKGSWSRKVLSHWPVEEFEALIA